MKVLTFGWDFPPVKNGGLGVACLGLTEALIEHDVDVVFVLPREQDINTDIDVRFANIDPEGIRTYSGTHEFPPSPYQTGEAPFLFTLPDGRSALYAHNLIEEVYRYAARARVIAEEEAFDLIHAHDWTSYLAGMEAKRVSDKPLMLHVHATAFDQAAGDNVDPSIFDIEKKAFSIADSIVAVSQYTKDLIVRKYGVSPNKVNVVHNGVDIPAHSIAPALENLKRAGTRIVFYNGRITIQKGLDHLMRAAKRVLEVEPNVVFVISGWGDMERQVMHQVGQLGISEHVIFAGSLWDEERDRMYKCADLVVMPSVSEPFGLVPFEALAVGTPVLISKQSGASEVLKNALKVDFWDVDEMANKIVAAIRHPMLGHELAQGGRSETSYLTWDAAAKKVIKLYEKLLNTVTHYRTRR